MKHLYEPAAFSSKIGSYWQTTANPIAWPKLDNDTIATTTIIGAGYTGLNCALQLAMTAKDPGSIILIDTHHPGFGASGRNGGFCCMGGSKLSWQQITNQFGEEECLNYFNTQGQAIESVRENLQRFNIDASPHSRGETQLAHRPCDVKSLMAEKRELAQRFGINASFINKQQLAQNGLNSPHFHGALTTPLGFALNPMRYTSGLAIAAQSCGIRCFGKTQALRITRQNGLIKITTPSATITTTNLVIATNGYSSEDLPDWLKGRLLPVISSVLVTQPLSQKQLEAQGWTSSQMCYDTRNLLHYFRLMPTVKDQSGPRMLFGMRGGIKADGTSIALTAQNMHKSFKQIFPAWADIKIPYQWSGLVCMTRHLTSYTGPIPDYPGLWTSLAYHGNGVAMASHCGKLLGQMINRHISSDALPAPMRQIPKQFIFPSMRRNYLRAAYAWYMLKDHAFFKF